MSAKMFRKAFAWGLLFAASTAASALAQVCPSCGPAPVVNPCSTCSTGCCNVCETMQPVIQPCYQTVPVTEYRQCKRTVQKPVCDVEYVDQPVTEYRPITEQKTAEVPTVNWQTVTECKTVQRDMGCWTTHYECRQKCSPCAYDPRPGVAGWWNRTSYSMRSAFQPSMVARRTWVPNVVTQQIPVTRQVAQYGTRQVCYNVTRMEAYNTTRKVAVNKVRYVAEEITEMQPVTVMRTIPSGTTVAWVPSNGCGVASGAGTSTALAPTPDPHYSRGSGSGRTADRSTYDEKLDNRKFSREAPPPDAYSDPATNGGAFLPDKAPVKVNKLSAPVVHPADGQFPEARAIAPEPVNTFDYGPETVVPSVVKTSRWTARNPKNEARPIARPETPKSEPTLAGRGVTVAEKSR